VLAHEFLVGGALASRARNFTVISNALAQRRGSAVTVGVAVYILSLPTGSPVTIDALCEHFSEGEILISRALRELEAAGYLERRRERTPTGQVRTRTYFYNVPGSDGPDDPPKPPRPRKPPTVPDAAPPAATPTREPTPAPGGEETGNPAPALADADPKAVAVLTALRRVDPRLVLSAQEAARLAPAVAEWLVAGVGPREITELLTVRLPDRFRARPASVLASASGRFRCPCRPRHRCPRRASALPCCPSRPATAASAPSAHRSPGTAGTADDAPRGCPPPPDPTTQDA
jgi:DNA-binding transcriptional ArsR family regulator